MLSVLFCFNTAKGFLKYDIVGMHGISLLIVMMADQNNIKAVNIALNKRKYTYFSYFSTKKYVVGTQ